METPLPDKPWYFRPTGIFAERERGKKIIATPPPSSFLGIHFMEKYFQGNHLMDCCFILSKPWWLNQKYRTSRLSSNFSQLRPKSVTINDDHHPTNVTAITCIWGSHQSAIVLRKSRCLYYVVFVGLCVNGLARLLLALWQCQLIYWYLVARWFIITVSYTNIYTLN